ncbi:sodium-dependent transporter [Sansalvadorimonas verongulae]|uniref:sodium-dependent transporter n=1 Tax=Sansalvadorimonas verongulae TaxID=2172824 RepID=UPI0012BB6A8F|nr:sodium-dependent transporter [Sansalvadorimonas verongulae]MTI15116.1 sodium-dependent transporter [Sansalvadorimonas verongulae]
MAEQQAALTAQTWTHRWTFVLAAAGSAIGLGNLWKFPYITGVNGGGAFVLVYLICIAVIGLPIMMAETALGRHGRHSPIVSMRELARESGVSKWWGAVGWLGALTGFLILSFYSVVAGWAIDYTLQMFSGTFQGMSAAEIGSNFDSMLANPVQLTLWHSIFMLLTGLVIARGVHKGLESGVRVMMPALMALLLVVLIYSATSSGHFMEGLSFLFSFHPEDLSWDAVLAAMGHAFFTLSLGMCAIMAYGAYMPKKASIARTASSVVLLDTAIALMAGMAIFPLVFANGMEPGAGPGLLFVTLTSAFVSLPGGQMIGGLFFLLVVLAALSSAISLVEPTVAWVVERFSIGRAAATVAYCILVWLFGLGTVFSFNEWSGESAQLFGMTFFEFIDYLTANITLPLGGLLIAVFAGWTMKRSHIYKELNIPLGAFNLWRAMCRVVAPICVLTIFYFSTIEEPLMELLGITGK